MVFGLGSPNGFADSVLVFLEYNTPSSDSASDAEPLTGFHSASALALELN